MKSLGLIILNTINPTYEEVYVSLTLFFGYLILTLLVEMLGFWLAFRKTFKEKEVPKDRLFDMIFTVGLLNVITFCLGCVLYTLVVAL